MARSLGPRHVRKQVRSLFSGSSSVSVPGGYPKLSQVAARRSRAAGPRRPRDRAGFVLAAAGLIAADRAQHQIPATASRGKNLYFVRRRSALC